MTGAVLTAQSSRTPAFGRRGSRSRAISLALPNAGWKTAGALALLCSTVAWASLPRPAGFASSDAIQWQALGVAPLSSGGASGMAMAPTEAVAPLEVAPQRSAAAIALEASKPAAPVAPPADAGPVRIRGRAGDGLYWALRAAGASPQAAADYLAALATQIDVGGEVGPYDSFDLVMDHQQLLYAGLQRWNSAPIQLVRWTANGRSEWVDAASPDRPVASQASGGFVMPAMGPITSYFGYRYHPILHFTRFHAGIDIGAGWGSPIVAAADGEVAAAGWDGGYGRAVHIVHAGGLMSVYGHMSAVVAQPGSFVHAGQLIGYVGASGLATGPHLHFEIRQNGNPVNPLAVRFASVQIADNHVADGVKARLKALLSVGVKRG
jgi:murein DD-endopeptidase MepM/ murein hydrolase activator NlpD